MTKGRIKAVLFIIVFLLVIAVAVNLLMDMQSTRKQAEATPSADPYANTPDPSVTGQAQGIETAAPSALPTVAPTVAPTPVPTPTPVQPTPSPAPMPTAEPLQPAVPQGEVIDNGSFVSETGTPLNLRAEWTATVLDDQYVKVTLEVPKNLSEQQKSLLKQLEDSDTPQNHPNRKSFREKMKDLFAKKDK